MVATHAELKKTQEPGCFAITMERKYYHLPEMNAFIKRGLRKREWQFTHDGRTHVPRLVPVPKVLAAFEDDGSFYLITQYVQGVSMASLKSEQKDVVIQEIEGHRATLNGLRSNKIGGPTGLIVPPWRVLVKTLHDNWKFKEADTEDYVFCHNDLSQHNVIVDPESLKINAIIDWEFAGYWPVEFEGKFWLRPGPSVALGEERDDSEELAGFLVKNGIA